MGSGGDRSGNTTSRIMGGTPICSHMNQRDLLIFLGRRVPHQFLKHYKLACSTNREDTKDNYVHLLPLSLVGATNKWYLDLTDVERENWGNINSLFPKRFRSERLANDLVILIS